MSSYLEWKKRAIVMGSGGWWLPPNFDPDDCLAAYQFKGAGSESAALTDLTGHGYELTKNDPDRLMDFDNSAGFVWARNGWRSSRYLHNAVLTKDLHGFESTEIQSYIIRYASLFIGAGYDFAYRLTFVNGHLSVYYPHNHEWQGEWVQNAVYMYRTTPSWTDANGVIGYNMGLKTTTAENSGDLYINGALIPVDNRTTETGLQERTIIPLFGHDSAAGNVGPYTIVAGAFYKKKLKADEMSYLYYQIAAI